LGPRGPATVTAASCGTCDDWTSTTARRTTQEKSQNGLLDGGLKTRRVKLK
jgi:hypothetical protein